MRGGGDLLRMPRKDGIGTGLGARKLCGPAHV
jgi:hypothetical protein